MGTGWEVLLAQGGGSWWNSPNKGRERTPRETLPVPAQPTSQNQKKKGFKASRANLCGKRKKSTPTNVTRKTTPHQRKKTKFIKSPQREQSHIMQKQETPTKALWDLIAQKVSAAEKKKQNWHHKKLNQAAH